VDGTLIRNWILNIVFRGQFARKVLLRVLNANKLWTVHDASLGLMLKAPETVSSKPSATYNP